MRIMTLLFALLVTPISVSDTVFIDRFELLPEVSLTSSTARSLDRVGIELPPAWDSRSEVFIEFVNVPGTRPIPVESDDAGLFIRAPFHPAVPDQGGLVTLRAVSGQEQSLPFILELMALEDAPGAFAEQVEALREHIDGFAKRRGSSFEGLQQLSFEETPNELLPLKYAQSFVDDPENPNSLSRIADGTSDLLNPGERRFLDQISANTALAELIGLETEALGVLQPPSMATSANFKTQTPSFNAFTSPQARACINEGPTINGAAQLSAAMWEAKFSEIAISGDPALYLNALGITLAGGSMIPVYGEAFLAAGAGVAAWQASRSALAGLNPSKFESISAAVSRQRFEEDAEEPGQYFDVQVVAASTGWTVDQAIVDAVINALGAAGSSAQIAQITQADFLLASAVNVINQGASNYVGAQEGGVIKFCPQQWSVDISSPLWSEARSVFGHFEVDSDAQTFLPRAFDEDFLSVSNVAQQFAQEKIDIDIAIGVDPIVVIASPQRVQVSQPGGIAQITATVENAVVPSLFWDPGPGSWDDGGQQPTNEGGTRPLKLPSDPDLYPFTVEIESLSRKGLRADNQPPRRDTVRVVLVDEIVVSPANACLENGDSEQFTATQADEPASVVWSLESTGNSPANLGDITQTGRYVAPPSGSGEVLIVASSVDDPDVRGVALVEVGSCECFWSLSIAGDGAWSGPEAGHGFLNCPLCAPFTLVFFPESGTGGGNAQILQGPAVTPGETGTFPIDVFGFQSDSRVWVVTADPDDGTSATLFVEENIDETVMTGSVTGTALTVLNDEELLRNFDLNFRSAGIDGSCGDEF